MSSFAVLASTYPTIVEQGDVTDVSIDWSKYVNVTLSRCESCSHVRFAGCRSTRSTEESTSKKNPKVSCVQEKNVLSTDPLQCYKKCCNEDRLHTLPVCVAPRSQTTTSSRSTVEDGAVPHTTISFCHGATLAGAKPCLNNTDQLQFGGCINCRQRTLPLTMHTFKCTEEELEYALEAFPAETTNIIHHTLLACKCCGVMGFPGAHSQLTTIHGANPFWSALDDDLCEPRQATHWQLDHTPDCPCGDDEQNPDQYFLLPIQLHVDELKYASRAVQQSLPCAHLASAAAKVVDMLQTACALANNSTLATLSEECTSEADILAQLEQLETLLQENERFFPAANDSFPMLVLSDIPSFVARAKALRQTLGTEVWTKRVAMAFGALLRRAKAARLKRPSRGNKVTMSGYMTPEEMSKPKARTADLRTRASSN